MSTSIAPIFVHFDDNDSTDGAPATSDKPRVTRMKSIYRRANSTLYTVNEHGDAGVNNPVTWADLNVEDDFYARVSHVSRISRPSAWSGRSRDFWPDEKDISSYYGIRQSAMADFVRTHQPALVSPFAANSVTSPAPCTPHIQVTPPLTDNSANAGKVCLSLDAFFPEGPSLTASQGAPHTGTGEEAVTLSIFESLASRPSFNARTVNNTTSTHTNEQPASGHQQKIFLQALC